MDDVVWIGNDHGGYCAKCKIVKYLDSIGVRYKDIGAFGENIVRYPYYASQVAAAVSEGRAAKGILICSTGIGMSIVANKYRNVRAALCADILTARLTRQHNDSNILCLGGKIIGAYEVIEIVSTWLTTEYIGGRHSISLGLIEEAENQMLKGDLWIQEDREQIK